MNINKSGA